jgi:hypothetical protein
MVDALKEFGFDFPEINKELFLKEKKVRGTPLQVTWRRPLSIAPALKYFPISFRTRLSLIFRATRCMSTSWLTVSKTLTSPCPRQSESLL